MHSCLAISLQLSKPPYMTCHFIWQLLSPLLLPSIPSHLSAPLSLHPLCPLGTLQGITLHLLPYQRVISSPSHRLWEVKATSIVPPGISYTWVTSMAATS